MKQSRFAVSLVAFVIIAAVALVVIMLVLGAGKQQNGQNSQLSRQEVTSDKQTQSDMQTEAQVDTQVSNADEVLDSIDTLLKTNDVNFNDSDIKELE